jgi:hypothetical protein
MPNDLETSANPTGRVLLNWTDGKSLLGGSVLHPPKEVWLEERGAGKTASYFEIEQLFDNLLRRGLAQLGGMTSREVETIPAEGVGVRRARSEKPWQLPNPSGMRLRAIYRFRNGSGAVSSKLISHRFARAEAKASGGGDVGLEAFTGVPVGVQGKGEIGITVQFAVDPIARVSVVSAAEGKDESVQDLVRATYEELAEFERKHPTEGAEGGFDPEQATLAFEDLFSDFLTDEAPKRWQFTEPEIEGGAGSTVEFKIKVEARDPGRSLLAIRVEDVKDPSRVAFSDIFALEVDEQLQIQLLPGSAIGVEEIVYKRGTLLSGQLQREIDQLWSSLEEDPELAAVVKASGITGLDRLEDRPIRVLEEVAGISPGSILVAITGVAEGDLWREVLLPRIRERFGEAAVKREQQRD